MRKVYLILIIFSFTLSAQQARFKGVEVTWLGHAAFQIKSPEGRVVLIDPWIENPKAPSWAKEISKADIILVTHGHFDHLGNTVEIAKRTGAKVICIFEISRFLAEKGVPKDQLVGMNYSGTVSEKGLKITMVPAVHSSGLSSDGKIVEGGNPAGFIIEFENGFKIYHTGDTGLFGDMELIGRIYQPDLMLICIGGHFTMGPRTAAEAIKLVKPKFVIPMHYGTFPILVGTPGELKKYLPEELRKSIIEISPGETAK
jgi:L-ascorbate metabolism protein UlaG (beta-lactamase superfamily)